ncbi:MAG: hypothetical protein ACR2G3_07940, partial [Solirubrobacterales bacterium]
MGAPGLVIVTDVGSPGDGLAAAAALAVATASAGQTPGRPGVVLAEVGGAPQRRPTLLSSASARAVEGRLARLDGIRAAARGRVCWAGLAVEDGWRERLAGLVAAAGGPAVAHLPASQWREALDDDRLPVAAAAVRADVPPNRSLLALLAGELRTRGVGFRVVTRPLGLVGARRALAGLEP